MKRLALLAATAFMALLLSACGDNAEKKAEDKAATEVQQENVKADDVKKDDVNKEESKKDENDTTKETPAAGDDQKINQ
jgi:PBP1b-binding outer membrane lipoprotein LpoB